MADTLWLLTNNDLQFKPSHGNQILCEVRHRKECLFLENEKFWNEFCEMYGKARAAKTKSFCAINEQRCAEIKTAYDLLVSLAKENGIEASVKCAPVRELGHDFYIELNCDALDIPNSQMDSFLTALKLADDISICPLTTGQVSISLGFKKVIVTK